MSKNKQKKTDILDYEGYQYGPITLERMGRFVSMKSNMNDQYESRMKEVRDKRPEFKKAIDAKIQELVSLASHLDPIEILTSSSIHNSFVVADEYSELTSKLRESFIEYAQGVLIGLKKEYFVPDESKRQDIDRFTALISEIQNDVIWYFGSEIVEGKNDPQKEGIRFQSITHFLQVRGDSYQEHHIEMVRELFAPHDGLLSKTYNVTTDQILVAVKEIEDQVIGQVNRNIQFLLKLRALHEVFKKYVDEKGIESFASIEDMRDKFNDLPEVQVESEKLAAIHDELKKNPFIINPNDKLPAHILNLLSSHFGDNEAFLKFKKSPGWPTNNSIVFEKPLIEYNGQFYCFGPQILFRQIGDILEGWIESANQQYFTTTFQEKRAEFLESKALRFLNQVLPEAKVYPTLYYTGQENGKPKRCETDGIVLYDSHLFIVEAKAGSLSLSARRGGLERTDRDLKELIENAYVQAKRTLEYINNNAVPVFENEDGSLALEIKDKTNIKHVYLINVTLENLGHLATQLNSLKSFGFIKGREWPWSVFINDLRIISEVTELPSIFLHFLQRRIRANDYPQFITMDELDFFTFYLHEGLYLEDERYKKPDLVVPVGFTEDLDRYYDFIAGRAITGEKPQLQINPKYKELVRKIEQTGKSGFTELTTRLLDFDNKTMDAIIDGIHKSRTASLKDGRDHDLSMYFNGLNLGLMVSVGTNRKSTYWNDIDEHCHMKMYQTKLKEWILMTVDVLKDGNENIDFRMYSSQLEHNAEIEANVKRFKEIKMKKYLATGKKPERNETCPCGSGMKYKNCCMP